MIVVVDNYDSFTYNLVQYLGELGVETRVVRNDEVTPSEIARLAPRAVLLSPGPGAPDGAGVTLAVIRELAGRLPIFGVCLGHQSIAQAFGARIVRASRLMHGRTSPIHHAGRGVFRGLPSPLVATRYHSLVVAPDSVPASLEVTGWTEHGEVMGLRHRELQVEGVQFHPESFLTEHGHAILRGFFGGLGP